MANACAWILYIMFLDNLQQLVSATYSYKNQDKWPELCQNGDLQSPMKINTSIANHTDKSFTLIDYNTEYAAELVLEGEHLFITKLVASDKRKRLPILQSHITNSEHFDYYLKKIDFHFSANDSEKGCEHVIDGNCAELEIHFEHSTAMAPSYYIGSDNGRKFVARHVYYSARFQVTNQAGRKLESDLFSSMRYLADQKYKNKTITKPFTFTPSKLMGTGGKAYHYYGSRSYPEPDCAEDVVWVLQEEPMFISKEELAYLRKIHGGEGFTNKRKITHNDSSAEYSEERTLSKLNFQYLLQDESGLRTDEDVKVNIFVSALFYSSKYLFILTLISLFIYYLTY